MKRVYQVEVETESDFELDPIKLASAVARFAKKATETKEPGELSVEGLDFKAAAIELRFKLVESAVKPKQPSVADRTKYSADPRIVDSERLLELITLDPVSPAYQSRSELGNLLDFNGRHIVTVMLAFVNVEDGADTLRHRVEVMAKAKGSMKPLTFLMDLPTSAWDKLRKV